MVNLYPPILGALLWASTALAEPELPEIELPEYIISGVERATRIGGERMKTSVATAASAPSFGNYSRPPILSASVWMPPDRPKLTDMVNPLTFQRAEVSAGSFSAARAGIGIGVRGSKGSIASNGQVRKPQRRVRPGDLLAWGLQIAGSTELGSKLTLVSELSFARREFLLHYPSIGKVRAWSDFNAGVLAAPSQWRFGRTALSLDFSAWQMSAADTSQAVSDGTLAGNQTSISVVHTIQTPGGWFDLRVLGEFEDHSATVGRPGLGSFEGAVFQHPLQWLKAKLGMGAYFGTSYQSNDIKGINPVLQAWIDAPFDGILTVSWTPNARLITLRSLYETQPHLTNVVNGAVVKDAANLRVGYERVITSRLRLNLETHYRDLRHWPLPAVSTVLGVYQPDSKNKPDDLRWGIAFSRTRSLTTSAKVRYAFSRRAYAEFLALSRSARVVNNPRGEEVPLLAPGDLTVRAGYDIGRGWKLSSTAVWTPETPLDFEGWMRRPGRILWNATVSKQFSTDLELELELSNMLNESTYDIPSYDLPPLFLLIGGRYRFD